MYRVGLFVFAAFSALALGFGPLAAEAGAPKRISGPHSHENLSIYFVHGVSAPGPVPLTLAEALGNKTVEVIETGNVRNLAIVNHGDREVFVQMGDIVKGGRQDRVLTRSLLLPPRSGRVAIGSYCVERGRWSRRGKENVLGFSSALRMLPSKAAKLALATPPGEAQIVDIGSAQITVIAPAGSGIPIDQSGADLTALPRAEQRQRTDRATVTRRSRARRRRSSRRRYARRRSPSRQGAIWAEAANTQDKLSAALGLQVRSHSSPDSLQLALENKALNQKIDGFVAALKTKADASDDIIGLVFAVGGQINSGDVYPSNGLFKKMWPKLLKAAATEAIGESTKKPGAAPSVETVTAFLKDAESGKIRRQENVGHLNLETRSTKRAVYNATRRARRRAKPGDGADLLDILHGSYIAH